MSQLEGDQAIVRMLLDVEEGLSDWEVRFVESLGRWVFDEGRQLTDRQRAKVDEVLVRLGL